MSEVPLHRMLQVSSPDASPEMSACIRPEGRFNFERAPPLGWSFARSYVGRFRPMTHFLDSKKWIRPGLDRKQSGHGSVRVIRPLEVRQLAEKAHH